LASTIAAVGILALVVSALGGRYLVDRALRPLRNIDHTARAMVEGDFVARVRIDRADTELGQLARALNEAFDRLHAALERQRRFTADASHELRTPLSTMSTEIQWALGQSRASEAYRGSLEVCLRASARMQTIVERLLALARGDADADVVACAPVSLDEVVGAVVRDLTPLAKARSLELAVRVSPVCCMGDRDRLVEAVTNVVENAIRYNREGGRVSVAVHQQAGQVEIVVADTGVGIDRDDLPRVFEPFFRSDPARTRGGSGLGLSLTRATVRRHGGDVRCDSERGRGTTITISLPAHASASHRS
jgi:signal transduction histidine kinase